MRNLNHCENSDTWSLVGQSSSYDYWSDSYRPYNMENVRVHKLVTWEEYWFGEGYFSQDYNFHLDQYQKNELKPIIELYSMCSKQNSIRIVSVLK